MSDKAHYHSHMWFPTGQSRVIANLSLIIVSPGKRLPLLSTHDTVKRATGHVNNLLVSKRTQYSLGGALMGVITVTKTIVVSLAPVIRANNASISAKILVLTFETILYSL